MAYGYGGAQGDAVASFNKQASVAASEWGGCAEHDA